MEAVFYRLSDAIELGKLIEAEILCRYQKGIRKSDESSSYISFELTEIDPDGKFSPQDCMDACQILSYKLDWLVVPSQYPDKMMISTLYMGK